MPKLELYLIKNTLVSILAVILTVSALFIVITLIGEARSIGQGSYNIARALLYVLYLLPSNVLIVLPVLAMLGTMIGLGNLAYHRELVMIRASGYSTWRISKAVAKAAVAVMVISWLVGSYIGPKLQHIAKLDKAAALESRSVYLHAQSTWLRHGNEFIHIANALPGGRLLNIDRYLVKDHQLKQLLHAQSALYTDQHWQAHDITKLTFDTHKIKKQTYPYQTWKQLVTPGLLKVLLASPESLSLVGLYDYIQYRAKNHLATAHYELNFWTILLAPLTCLILMLIAVPFVFGPLRSATFGLRLVLGTVLGFAFFILNQAFAPMALVYQFSPFLGVLAPIVLFFGIYLIGFSLASRQ